MDRLDISGNLITPTGAGYIAGICGHTGHLTELVRFQTSRHCLVVRICYEVCCYYVIVKTAF